MNVPGNLAALWRAAARPAGALALSVGSGVLVAHIVTSQLPTTYEASASSIVTAYERDDAPAGSGEQAARPAQYDPQLVRSLAGSVARLAESSSVAQQAAEQAGLPTRDVLGHIDASYEPGLSIITVTAKADTGAKAAVIANNAVEVLRQRVAEGALSGRKGVVYAQPLDRAMPPTTPASPKPLLNDAIGALAGLLVGCGVLALRRRFDNRLRTCEQIEAELGLPILATLPPLRRAYYRSGARRCFRRRTIARPIRTAIASLAPLTDPVGRKLLVTSCYQDDGKTFVAALLGLGLAQQRYHVTLLEGQMRHPPLAHHFPGSAPHTVQRLLEADDGQPVGAGPTGLRVITSEPTEPEVSRALLRSRAYARLMELAASTSDVVVINGPGILASGDISPLAGYADGAVLVVRSGGTHVSDARRAVQVLRRLEIPVAGVIVTDAIDSRHRRPRHTEPSVAQAAEILAAAWQTGRWPAGTPGALPGRALPVGTSHPNGDGWPSGRQPLSLPPGRSAPTGYEAAASASAGPAPAHSSEAGTDDGSQSGFQSPGQSYEATQTHDWHPEGQRSDAPAYDTRTHGDQGYAEPSQTHDTSQAYPDEGAHRFGSSYDTATTAAGHVPAQTRGWDDRAADHGDTAGFGATTYDSTYDTAYDTGDQPSDHERYASAEGYRGYDEATESDYGEPAHTGEPYTDPDGRYEAATAQSSDSP